MSARVPRRSFASPFVLTLAAAPACTPSSTAVAPNPPTTEAPSTDPQPDPTGSETPTTDPSPTDGTTTAPPSEPRQWSLSAEGDGCVTQIIVSCAPKPGEPPRTCNPPAPQSYPCPTYNDGEKMDLGLGLTIESDTEGRCYVRQPPSPCPKGAMCNPPPPREVPCPK